MFFEVVFIKVRKVHPVEVLFLVSITYVTHHNKRYLMSVGLILRYLVNKENNKKNTPSLSYIFKSSSSIFISLVSLKSFIPANYSYFPGVTPISRLFRAQK